MFLLDTDALSALEKPSPDAGLLTWLETVDWLDLHLSVITVGELWSPDTRDMARTGAAILDPWQS